MKSSSLFLTFVLLLFPLSLLADDHDHHLDPNEKVGTVSFPTSCSASVQKAFERGVALLHSFEYEVANHQFEEVAQKDPQCGMAYWGQSISRYHQLWGRPNAEDAKRGWELVQKAQATGTKTQRESDYIDAVAAFYRNYDETKHEKYSHAYSQAMAKVYQRYPEDHEAAVFYALSLLASSNDKTGEANAQKAISILNQLFEKEPDHPGIAHYLIHSCDNPKFASQGLAAARRYAGIAAASPHAVHMPSHIFARLGLWQDDINSNLAALKIVDKQAAMHVHTMHHRMHSMDFLVYAYLQIGDNVKAKGMVDDLLAFKKDDIEKDYQAYFDEMAADFPARYALERRQWNDALALQPRSSAGPSAEAVTYWAQTIAAGHLHDAAAAQKAATKYEALRAEALKGRKGYMGKGMRTDHDEVQAWLAFAQGKNDEALRRIRALADTQDDKGKAEVALPAREMLADMLLALDRPQEALAEYEKALHTDPNRFNGLYGAAQAAEATKQPQKAAEYYAQLLKNCDNGEHSDRPELAHAKTLVAQIKPLTTARQSAN
jgi:hypothetical protein